MARVWKVKHVYAESCWTSWKNTLDKSSMPFATAVEINTVNRYCCESRLAPDRVRDEGRLALFLAPIYPKDEC